MTRELPGLTTQHTLRRGEPIGQGTDATYHRLELSPGEPHLRRIDLAPDAPPPARRRSLLHVAYVTDLHVLDAASPGRYEFVNRYYGPPELHLLLPSYRPQEVLQAQACAAMIRTLNAIVDSPVTGAPIGLVLCTGDLTDNVQTNELRRVMSILEGGTVEGCVYDGVGTVAWGDPAYWHPDRYADDYKRRRGFPTYPGLLDEACRPFAAEGIARPWLSCLGNHDALVQGTARPNEPFARILVGAQKARLLPPELESLQSEQLNLYIPHPEFFLSGPTATIAPDPGRGVSSRPSFVHAHLHAAGTPHGHGFSAQNLAAETAYYVDDSRPPVRLVMLDTVNASGHYQGSIGAAQLAWLEERLAEVHSRYRDAQGRAVEGGNEDRLVVICSHHGLSSLTNDLAAPGIENDLPRVLGPEVESLLHRFPNVVLWINGHTHRNRVRPHPDPAARSAGFWEVTTSSLLDWPCQARLVEIVSNGNGTLSAFCTMVDSGAPADPASVEGLARVAALHRELAANDPFGGMVSGAQGTESDRNVELVIPAPFPVD